eukprot:365166-Chlamydomonas_euryale.AAC.14
MSVHGKRHHIPSVRKRVFGVMAAAFQPDFDGLLSQLRHRACCQHSSSFSPHVIAEWQTSSGLRTGPDAPTFPPPSSFPAPSVAEALSITCLCTDLLTPHLSPSPLPPASCHALPLSPLSN